jgi:hypothetical protein
MKPYSTTPRDDTEPWTIEHRHMIGISAPASLLQELFGQLVLGKRRAFFGAANSDRRSGRQ